MQNARQQGFTLIELSMVLVIIGLIVGGVLVGQDLIKAAEVRATVTQLERYNTAANTFQTKYNALPGDVPAAQAASFGMVARYGTRGRGDGDGLIEGYNYPASQYGPTIQAGETLFFWEDLSSAHMIEDNFNTASDAQLPVGTTNFAAYLPAAKLGAGNFIYVYSGGVCPSNGTQYNCNGINYFGLSAPTNLNSVFDVMLSNPGLTVSQAYVIDTKVDDGLPTSGNVQTNYVNSWTLSNDGVVQAPAATTPSSSTCLDQGGNSNNPWQYSTSQSNGNGVNCALSFQMQCV